MKLFTTIICLLFLTTATAQDLTKDTIHLNDLEIKKSRKKVASAKFSSFCSYLCNLPAEYATLVNLPEGYLKSVSFKFNIRGMGMGEYKQYQTTRIELTFYEVTTEGRPGEKIEHNPAVVTVDKDFSGKMVINLSNLNIKNPGKIFIGLKRVNPEAIKRNDFIVAGVCGPKEEYTTFVKSQVNSKWYKYTSMPALKMEVKVEVL